MSISMHSTVLHDLFDRLATMALDIGPPFGVRRHLVARVLESRRFMEGELASSV